MTDLPINTPPAFLPGQPRAAGGVGDARAVDLAAGGSDAPAAPFRIVTRINARFFPARVCPGCGDQSMWRVCAACTEREHDAMLARLCRGEPA